MILTIRLRTEIRNDLFLLCCVSLLILRYDFSNYTGVLFKKKTSNTKMSSVKKNNDYPRDVGVGTLLVGKYITTSSSCTALFTEEAER